MELDLKDEKNKTKQVDLTLELIAGRHRAGELKRRDETLKTLNGKTLTKKQSAQLEGLKTGFAAEALYQQRAADAAHRLYIIKHLDEA